MICRLHWFERFFFPFLFIGLSVFEFIGFAVEKFPFQHMTLFDWFMFCLWTIILYFMIFMLTVRYEISDSDLIIQSFIIRKKLYPITDIIFIEQKGMFSKFSESFNVPEYVRLHLRNRKKILICGLSEQYKFIQLLRSKLCC